MVSETEDEILYPDIYQDVIHTIRFHISCAE